MMRKFGVGLTLLLAVGCSAGEKKDDDKNKEGDSDVDEIGAVGTVALSELNLDSSIDPTIPSNVVDPTAVSLRGANLLSGKSLERCLLQQSISEFKMNVANVKMQLCSLTSMPGLEWGKAYNISMTNMGGGPGGGGTPPPGGDVPPGGPGGDLPPGGPGGPMPLTQGAGAPPGMPDSLQVKMDNSVEGEYTIYVCSDKVLQQKIRVKGATDTGATGSYAVKMDMGGDNVMELRGTFDNGITTAGRYVGTTQMRFSMGGMKTSSSIALDLGSAATDVHFVQSSREMATSFADLNSSTKELMAGRFGPDFGSAVVQRTGGSDSMFGQGGPGTPPEGDLPPGGDVPPPDFALTEDTATPETARAFFNVGGDNVAEDASAAFAEGGAYYTSATDLPLLADPAEVWAIEGWDCTTGLEEFTPPTDGGDKASACYEDSPFSGLQFGCFDGGFAPGQEVAGAEDFTAQRDDNGDIFTQPPPPPGPGPSPTPDDGGEPTPQ